MSDVTDDRLWRPDGADLWIDPRSDEPDRTHAPTRTALVDVSRDVDRDARPDDSPVPSDGSSDPIVPRTVRPRRRVVFALASIAVITVITAALVGLGRPSLDGTLGEAPLIRLFDGADPRRLPETIDVAWTVGVPLDADRGSSMIVRDDLVVVTLPAPERCVEPRGRCVELPDQRLERSRTALSVIDVASGRRNWTTHVELDTNEVDLLGVLSGVVVAELRTADGRVVVGFDAADGSERWRLRRGEAESFEILPGTSVVTRSTFGSRAVHHFIDPTTGAVVERVEGAIVATDHSGRWWLRDRSERTDALTMVDLGVASPRAQSPVDLGDSTVGVLSVVDGRPLAAAGGAFQVYDPEIGWTAADVRAPELLRTDGAGVEANTGSPPRLRLPDSIIAITPTSGNDFAFTGGGSVYGASLSGEETEPIIDVRWQLRGVITQVVSTDRGLLLVVANEGGAALRVVDGVSGTVLAEVQMFTGALESLRLVGNGFLTKRSAEVGVELAAVGLDGFDRWSLVGSDPFAVGDGVVVTRTDTDDGVRFTARRDSAG